MDEYEETEETLDNPPDPKIGERVKILAGILVGATGYISNVNTKKHTIVAMIPAGQVHPQDRQRFIVKRTRYGYFVPLVLARGEWELYGKRIISIPKGLSHPYNRD